MTLAHITLATRNVERQCEFFHAAFGWPVIRRPDNLHRQAAWLEIAAGQQLHLLQLEEFRASDFEAEFGRHIALFWPARDLPALRDRLRAAGAELIEAERATPFERFFFRDPEGYVFEVIDRDGYAPE